MAVKKVVQVGNEVLRRKCEPVTEFGEELWAFLEDLKDTVRAEDGAGLAAPQVGVAKRVCVVDVEEGFFEFVNPVIVSAKGEQEGPEGCLSVKGKRGIVVRPKKVKIAYQDRTGERKTLLAKDFFARACCHEFDHLDGVLYIDKATHVEKD